MAGGGGGIQKIIINFIIDQPDKAFIGGAAVLYFYRTYATHQAYSQNFGKFDFQRKVERNEIKI